MNPLIKELLLPTKCDDVKVLRGREFYIELNRMIMGAREYIYFVIYIASLSRSTVKIYRALAEKAREGVDVRVVLNGGSTNSLRYNCRVYEYLKELEIPVILTSSFTHLKLYMADDKVIVGSHNLTESPRKGRDELSILIHSRYVTDILLNIFREIYMKEIQNSLEIYSKYCKQLRQHPQNHFISRDIEG